MKGKIQVFSVLICLTMLISMMDFSTVQAGREAAAPTSPPYAQLPYGTTYTKTPTFYWYRVTGATYYRLSIYRKSDNQYIVHNLDINAAANCYNRYCKYTPTTFINPMAYGTEYKFKMAAGNSDGLSSWSSLRYFTPKAGINSTFTSDTNGWQPKVGTWTRTAEGYYKGNSVTINNYISTRYDGVFGNFTYEARVYKDPIIGDGNFFGIVIRGDTSAYSVEKLWNYGYVFGLSDWGDFCVFRLDPVGASTTLISWTVFDVINVDGFNTLKVNAYGPSLTFFINGVFVGQIYDYTYSTGRVGLIYRFDGKPLLVDYVKLSMPTPSYSIRPETVGRPSNHPQ